MYTTYARHASSFHTHCFPVDFHSSEYLVGLLFPDRFFPGTNMTGAMHAAKGRDFVYRWMQRRYNWGFQARVCLVRRMGVCVRVCACVLYPSICCVDIK
jgi:hypothetical protein